MSSNSEYVKKRNKYIASVLLNKVGDVKDDLRYIYGYDSLAVTISRVLSYYKYDSSIVRYTILVCM